MDAPSYFPPSRALNFFAASSASITFSKTLAGCAPLMKMPLMKKAARR
jgi:hypothetical protein